MKLILPERIRLANLPTPIEKLEKKSKEFKKDIWIKRDDYTGSELSGNKVRKLEYSIKKAIDDGCDTLITCGAKQSNHARATAVCARKLGLDIHLVLSGLDDGIKEGNILLDEILCSNIHYMNPDDFNKEHENKMIELNEILQNEGKKPYIIPIGASNGIGTFGYFNAFKEILEQENEYEIVFDTIVVTVGSGGTFAGLYLANKLLNKGKKIIGISISKDSKVFIDTIENIIKETLVILDMNNDFDFSDITIIDDYKGLGYAISQKHEMDFIKEFAKESGIILDPVYTGKAMYGLTEELKKNGLKESKNILFIHTGGHFGILNKHF
jgi:D-cysteine desulfhydrase